MIRFCWLPALLAALTLSASTVGAHQAPLSLLALASPLGQERPETAEVDPPAPRLADCGTIVPCSTLQRFVKELLEKWTLLWQCGEFGQAEQVAAAAVAQCPHHLAAQHALIVSQIVNSCSTLTGSHCDRPASECCPSSSALRAVCQPPSSARCRFTVSCRLHSVLGTCREACPATTCCSEAARGTCNPCAAHDSCARDVVRATAKCGCGTQCACAKASSACAKDSCCAKQEQERSRALAIQHQKACESSRLIEARRNERKAYAEALEARLKTLFAGKSNVDSLLEVHRRLIIALEKECEAIEGYHQTLIRHIQPHFVPGLTPAGTFAPDLHIPIGIMPAPMFTEFRHVPLPPPTIIMHTGPPPIAMPADCYTALPHPPVYAPGLPPMCPAPTVCMPPVEVMQKMPGYPDQEQILRTPPHRAQPALCPVLHGEMVSATTPHQTRPALNLRIKPQGQAIVIHCGHFEARCDQLVLHEADNRVVLEGNVAIEVRRDQAIRIQAPRVVLNLKDGSIQVSGPVRTTASPTPPASAEPVSRPPSSAPMPRPVPTLAPMPRPRPVPTSPSQSQVDRGSGYYTFHQLLNESESRPCDAWRGWPFEQTTPVTPIRVHGGIGP